MKNSIYSILFTLGKAWGIIKRITRKKKRPILLKFTPIRTSRRVKRENKRHIDKLASSMFGKYAILIISVVAFGCQKQNIDPAPQQSATVVQPTTDTLVKFTLYSKRVPYIWKREINGSWVQDTVKTNSAIKYEIFDQSNERQGFGYWATMNTFGISTDSLHIIGEYKGRITQMASIHGQSAAYVVLSAIGPK